MYNPFPNERGPFGKRKIIRAKEMQEFYQHLMEEFDKLSPEDKDFVREHSEAALVMRNIYGSHWREALRAAIKASEEM